MSMTENEAIQVFKELLDVPCEMLVKYDSVTTEEQKNALVKIRVAEDMAIQVLEEIQKYRAIGTVESLKKLPAICDSLAESGMKAEKLIEELKAYRAIGTIEEFKALKEKSEPKKPNKIERKRDEYGFIYQIGKCPFCGKLVTDDRECCDCMQKLDWRE